MDIEVSANHGIEVRRSYHTPMPVEADQACVEHRVEMRSQKQTVEWIQTFGIGRL